MQRYNALRPPIGTAFVAMLFAIAAGPPAAAQPVFQTDSTLVLVPVSVVDRHGAVVSGLRSAAFTLTEDGAQQVVRSFSVEDAPVSMGIVLDLSGSMRPVLGAARESLRALLKDANPSDEAFLNAVSSRPRSYSGFTRDLDELLSLVAFEGANGSTALIDTAYESVGQLRSGSHPRKVLLLVSDGMDNHSRHSKAALLEEVLESDAQIYSIAVDGGLPAGAKSAALAESARGILLLQELAEKTGGLCFVVRSRADIAVAAGRLGEALRHQYTIGYSPSGDRRLGKWHRISVKVAGSGVRAYARSGYRLE